MSSFIAAGVMLGVLAFALMLGMRTVNENAVGVVFRFGKYVRSLQPGLRIVVPFIDSVEQVELQVVVLELDKQQVMTYDSVSITVLAAVYYQVVDPLASLVKISDSEDAIQQLGQAIVRKVLGMHSLAEVLQHSDTVVDAIQKQMDESADDWGLKITQIEIKDVQLPESMARAMAAVAEATREAQAKIIAAQGEADAAAMLQQAAEAMGPAALELRRLQTYREIGTDNAAIVVVTSGNSMTDVAGMAAAGQLAARKVEQSATAE